MQKAKKMFSVLLVLMLVIALAACSSNSQNKGNAKKEETNTKGDSSSSADSSSSKEAPIEITWLSFYPPDTDDTPVQKYLEETFNVKIKNMRIDRSNWGEQLNIKLASKEIPDIFWLWGAGDIENYATQGLLAELPVDLIKEKMPQFAKSVDEVDPKLWEYGKNEGKSYGIPLYWPDGTTPFLPAYNGKWLNAVGYNKAPQTLEEMEDVLYKFRNNDPDGNSKKDTYGISARGKDGLVFAFNSVFGAFGIQPKFWTKDANGELVFGMITEEARQGFLVLNKWWKDGIIDPEFITVDDAKSTQILSNGRVGMMDGGLWYHYHPVSGKIGSAFKVSQSDAELIVGKPVTGPDGASGGLAFGSKNSYIGMGIQVADDPEKMNKIFEILEATATVDEAYLMTTFGVEGEHYELKNGVPEAKPEYADLQKRAPKIGAGNFYNMFIGKSLAMLKYDYTQEQLDLRKKLTENAPIITDELTFSVPVMSEYPDLNKLVDEYYIKFITGEVNLTDGFDEFVKVWKQSGGEAITKQANEIYAENFN
ncbi:extracellular solute-binding protein [Paenibacillus tarimensis]